MAYADVILADSPVAYYRMGEASGLIQDSSGNGNHATTTVGTPTYSQTGALFGDANTAISFGGNSAFTVPDSASLDVGDVFTIEVWIKRTDLTSVEDVVCCKGTTTPQLSLTGAEGTARFTVSSAGQSYVHACLNIDDTAWHYVAINNDDNSRNLYIDGCNASIQPENSGYTFTSNAAVLNIGQNFFANTQAKLVIDELAIYPTMLTSAQIVAHWEAGMDPDWLEVEGVGASSLGPGI